jgi:hypothetical protein
MFGCNHKYEKVNKDGYQYCIKCGKAIHIECSHHFQTIRVMDHFRPAHFRFDKDLVIGLVYILRCTKCGIIKKEYVGTEDLKHD